MTALCRIISRIVLALICFSGLAFGQGFDYPKLTSPVHDEANLLKPSEVKQFRGLLKSLHRQGGPQIAVLTLPTIGDLTIEQASIEVADDWKLGSESKDNGILMLIVKDKRSVRIEVGQGLEGDLVDSESKRIIDYQIIPQFKKGNFGAGIAAALSQIIQETTPPEVLKKLNGQHSLKPKKKNLMDEAFGWLKFLLIFFFIIFTRFGSSGLFLLTSRSTRHSGGFGGGGFGGGGGFSGGGGGFSGGGASGEW